MVTSWSISDPVIGPSVARMCSQRSSCISGRPLAEAAREGPWDWWEALRGIQWDLGLLPHCQYDKTGITDSDPAGRYIASVSR